MTHCQEGPRMLTGLDSWGFTCLSRPQLKEERMLTLKRLIELIQESNSLADLNNRIREELGKEECKL